MKWTAEILGTDVFAVQMCDYWGAIDNKGNVVLPFAFEGILRIDNYSAFARYNGAYGILDLIALGS